MPTLRPTLTRATILPFVLAFAIGALWNNQGLSSKRVNDIHNASDAAPPEQRISLAYNTLLNLYRRAGDEEIYFTVAQALRGLPYDHARLTTRGRDTPESFKVAPPEDGHWHAPYTEVPIEYPVGLLAFVVLPSFFAHGDYAIYTRVFGALMAAFLMAAAALAIRAQPGRSDRERWWWMVALLLAHGALAVQRLDAIIAFGLAWTFWAASERRPLSTGVSLGASTALKFLPALLVAPLATIDRQEWKSSRSRRRAASGFVLAVAVGLAPMLVAPGTLIEVLRYHARRGLQVESTYAVLISAWRMVKGTLVPSVLSYGSFNLEGDAAGFFARSSTLVTLSLIAGLTVLCLRAPAPIDETDRRDRLALALICGITALWLSGKVFSPQYLTWAMPLVLAVSGRRGKTLTWILFVLYWITQYEMTGDYGNVKDQLPLGVITLLVRLPLLIAFGVVAARGLVRQGQAIAEGSDVPSVPAPI